MTSATAPHATGPTQQELRMDRLERSFEKVIVRTPGGTATSGELLFTVVRKNFDGYLTRPGSARSAAPALRTQATTR